jgi:hypothetical protein
MGVPTSKVGYTSATTGREIAKFIRVMWWHLGGTIWIILYISFWMPSWVVYLKTVAFVSFFFYLTHNEIYFVIFYSSHLFSGILELVSIDVSAPFYQLKFQRLCTLSSYAVCFLAWFTPLSPTSLSVCGCVAFVAICRHVASVALQHAYQSAAVGTYYRCWLLSFL